MVTSYGTDSHCCPLTFPGVGIHRLVSDLILILSQETLCENAGKSGQVPLSSPHVCKPKEIY